MNHLPDDYKVDDIRPEPAPPAKREGGSWWIWAALLVIGVVGVYWVVSQRDASPPQGSSLAWHTDIDETLAEARRSGRPALLVFSQPGCGACVKLKRNVLETEAFAEVVRGRAVPAHLNIQADRRAMDMVVAFGVNATPAVALVDAEGNLLHLWIGYRPSLAGDLGEVLDARTPPATMPDDLTFRHEPLIEETERVGAHGNAS